MPITQNKRLSGIFKGLRKLCDMIAGPAATPREAIKHRSSLYYRSERGERKREIRRSHVANVKRQQALGAELRSVRKAHVLSF